RRQGHRHTVRRRSAGPQRRCRDRNRRGNRGRARIRRRSPEHRLRGEERARTGTRARRCGERVDDAHLGEGTEIGQGHRRRDRGRTRRDPRRRRGRRRPVTGVVEQVDSKDGTTPDTPGGPIDCVLFDLDGVVYHGSRAIDGAVDGISWLHERSIGVNYVTNNATRTAEATAEKTTGLGIDTTAEEVTTSAQVLAERLAERFGPGARVHLLGTTGLRVALETAGLQITDTVDEAPVA